MINYLKNNWKTIAMFLFAALCGALAVYYATKEYKPAPEPAKPIDVAPLFAKDSVQIARLQASLDRANARLEATLSNLTNIQRQLAQQTAQQREQFDSLSGAFEREAARPNFDRELLELIGQ